jgi:uncharacterized protein
MAFGMTTVILSLANAGFYQKDSVLLAMAMFPAGIGQIIVGAMEFRKGNTSGTTAFLSFGLFWESFAFLLMLPNFGLSGFAPSSASLQAYLAMWGIFSFLMFMGTLRISGALTFVFGTLFITFFLLALGVGYNGVTTFGGYIGILCGLSAMYTSIAEVLNEVYGRILLPLFPVKRTS